MNNLGLGVMIRMFSGNEETVRLYNEMKNQVIKKLKLNNNELCFEFENGLKTIIFDNGQSCCETRYMRTDDNLNNIIGGILKEINLKPIDNRETEYGEYQIQFLEIVTDKGSCVLSNHNEHNGYYGGFSIEIK